MAEQIKQRVIFYIDGYNFYYGLKENNWKKYYWLDLVEFCKKFLSSNQELICVKYFSAPTGSYGKKERQSKFFQANQQNKQFKLILGNYMDKDVSCRKCHEVFQVPEEKKTDVNIATQLISDCINKACEISILISGDSDLTPPLEFIKNYNKNHKITVFFPPNRNGHHLKTIAHNTLHLQQFQQRFKTSLLPDEIELENGYKLKRPSKWT